MRKTREELLEMCPSWNEDRHDIVKVQYGDIPLYTYTEQDYIMYQNLEDGSIKNLRASNAYIWLKMGDFRRYVTLIGDFIVVNKNGSISSDFGLKIGGIRHNIFSNQMYGLKALSIFRYSGGKVKGFSNKDGLRSPSTKRNTEELSDEIINKILNYDLSDYGNIVRDGLKQCRELYEADKTNLIMEKCFYM